MLSVDNAEFCKLTPYAVSLCCVIMLNVIMLNVIMLIVRAPTRPQKGKKESYLC